MKLQAKKINGMTVHKCEHCGKESTNKGNMTRYHFDNCKAKGSAKKATASASAAKVVAMKDAPTKKEESAPISMPAPEVMEVTVHNSNPISEFPFGVANLSGRQIDDAWEFAMDCVDYPVELVDLGYNDPVTGEFTIAEGETSKGRGNIVRFRGVRVDRNRDGNYGVISTVTEQYATLPTIDVYRDLRDSLVDANIKHSIQEVYVSGNGGRQTLVVSLDEMVAMDLETPIRMAIYMSTSVDGTKKHSARIAVLSDNSGSGKGHEIFGLIGKDFSLSARHTTTIESRHIAMDAIIGKLVAEWNNTIMPMINLYADAKFDRNIAVDCLTELLHDADIPERHQKRILEGFNPEGGVSALKILDHVSGYMEEELSHRQERKDQFRKQISKSITTLLKRMK